MSCWAEKYQGLRAEPTLELNCMGYVRRILREEFRREFPGFLGGMRLAARGLPFPLRPVKRLRDGTVIVCGNAENPVRHIGIYCLAADRVVHADTDATPIGRVRLEPMFRLKHDWPLVSYWEVVSA